MAYKLLVVDDDKSNLEMFKEILTQEGYEVVVAYDGEEALAKIKETDPDIILLDLILPKKNGFEVLKEIRQNYKDKWRPVIIISGQSDLESVTKGYKLEADHYLTKPCPLQHLLRGVRIMVSLISARDTP